MSLLRNKYFYCDSSKTHFSWKHVILEKNPVQNFGYCRFSMLCLGPEHQPLASTSTVCSFYCQCAETSSPFSVVPSRYSTKKKINSPCRVLDMNFLTCLHLSISVGFFQYCSRTAARQLDRNLTFHKLVAYMIAFHTGEDLRVLLCNFIAKMY